MYSYSTVTNVLSNHIIMHKCTSLEVLPVCICVVLKGEWIARQWHVKCSVAMCSSSDRNGMYDCHYAQ